MFQQNIYQNIPQVSAKDWWHIALWWLSKSVCFYSVKIHFETGAIKIVHYMQAKTKGKQCDIARILDFSKVMLL